MAPASTYAELMQAMAPCGIVVATRYHNVMCALKLCKPTISMGYSRKFVALMESMGLADFTLSGRLTRRGPADRAVQGDENRQAELRQQMAARNAANQQSLDDQFAVLSALLFPGSKAASAPSGDEFARAPGRGD